jgi:hypothetical protein
MVSKKTDPSQAIVAYVLAALVLLIGGIVHWWFFT